MKHINRRDFIRTGSLASGGLLLAPMVLHRCTPPDADDQVLAELYRGFQNPPVGARPFVRWWWNGDRLSRQEILRELDVMKEAGIGGVEINPIRFPYGADPVGYETLQWLSDEWIEMLKVALQGAREKSMVCDMIVGSGWPFGGEFLEKEEQTQMVTIETIDLEGEQRYEFSKEELLSRVDPEIHSKNETVYRDLMMLRLMPEASDTFSTGLDLSDQLQAASIILDVPPGRHVLYYVVKLTGYMAVINGAPGAAGPVLNHYNKHAVLRYLNRLSGVLTEKIGPMGDHFRAMFCDSMELEGANWNDDLPDEFEKRMGYPLLPYLPFVLRKVGHMGNPLEEQYGTKFPEGVRDMLNRVRLDFYRTRLALFRERFVEVFHHWCHENGVQSRIQAYGRGMHPLETSMAVDIPECETWLRPDIGVEMPELGSKGRAYWMINKFVSSGARLAGKRLVSCEEITNTQMVFMATLERVKITGDQSNLSGVTHSILHGFNYSPPEAPFPGWVQYGTWLNERNPWWPYFPLWANYKARLSCVFQNTDLQSNVAILQPLTDLWLKYGPQRDPFPTHDYPDYQHNLWEVVHNNGDGCDYLSEKILQEATFRSGRLVCGPRSYQVLLIPETETMGLPTITALDALATAGGKVVFIGRKPFRSPHFLDQETRDREVRDAVDKLFENHSQNVILSASPGDDLLGWYASLQETIGHTPLVHITQPDKQLSQVSYLAGETRIFFFTNSSLSRQISFSAHFEVARGMHPWIWNPETGLKYPYPKMSGKKEMEMTLAPATSLLIVFEKSREGEEYALPALSGTETEIAGPWRLKLKHLNGKEREITLRKLVDFRDQRNLKTFAGEAVYTKAIQVDDPGAQAMISLGKVQGVSELALNGQPMGVKWYGDHLYDVSGQLTRGENMLSVKITTIAGNYLKSLEDNPTAQRWTRGQPYHPVGMIGPVKLYQSSISE
jgi:hypothetical protein